MEKNRIRPVKVGNGLRMSYAHQNEVLDMPNLIEVQTDSYQWFLDEGLKEVCTATRSNTRGIPRIRFFILNTFELFG